MHKDDLCPILTAALCQILRDMLIWFLHSQDRKPASNDAWEALGRIDKIRRDLERQLGREPTEMRDPHKRIDSEAYKHKPEVKCSPPSSITSLPPPPEQQTPT